MRALSVMIFAALAGCAHEPKIYGQTPTMVSVCGRAGYTLWGTTSLQDMEDVAERACAAYGKHATMIPMPDTCLYDTWSSVRTDPLRHFRCE